MDNKIYELLNGIKTNDFVCINNHIKGVIKRIDMSNRLLYILNFEIPFSDIVNIKKCCNLF